MDAADASQNLDRTTAKASNPAMRTWYIAGVFCILFGAYTLIELPGPPPPLAYVLFFLPGLLLLSTPWLLKLVHPSSLRLTVASVSIAVSVLLSLSSIGVQTFLKSIHPTTQLSRYPEVLGRWPGDRQAQIAHFPSSIPASAFAASFFYLPGFLQGPTILQLRFKLPPDEMLSLREKFRSRQIHAPNASSLLRYQSGDSLDDLTPFPDEYEIICLGPPDIQKRIESGDLNHAEIYGVAINEQTSKIIYWVEVW